MAETEGASGGTPSDEVVSRRRRLGGRSGRGKTTCVPVAAEESPDSRRRPVTLAMTWVARDPPRTRRAAQRRPAGRGVSRLRRLRQTRATVQPPVGTTFPTPPSQAFPILPAHGGVVTGGWTRRGDYTIAHGLCVGDAPTGCTFRIVSLLPDKHIVTVGNRIA